MWLIAGLGNPGTKYILNRHNVGFMVADVIVNLAGGKWKTESKAQVSKIEINGHSCLVVKPQTFMNLSGEAIQPLMHFYKIGPERLLVAHDEVDQPFGATKFQFDRGHGGQNGVRNIHQQLATAKYYRLRVGIGRPTNPQIDVATHVLQNFSEQEQKLMPELLEHCYKGLLSFVEDGYQKASSLFNKNIFEGK